MSAADSLGTEFQTNHRFMVAANILVDFFRGKIVDNINLIGLDHVIVLSVADKDTLLFRYERIRTFG